MVERHGCSLGDADGAMGSRKSSACNCGRGAGSSVESRSKPSGIADTPNVAAPCEEEEEEEDVTEEDEMGVIAALEQSEIR